MLELIARGRRRRRRSIFWEEGGGVECQLTGSEVRSPAHSVWLPVVGHAGEKPVRNDFILS